MLTTSFKKLFPLVFKALAVQMTVIICYVSIVGWLDLHYHLEDLHFPASIVSVMGTVIALLLAFRTNSSYDRWWEARTLWGAIVNDSRSWARQLLAFCQSEENEAKSDSLVRSMLIRQVAWCYALTRSLRGQDPVQDLDSLLDAEEIDSYRAMVHVPNEILLQQAVGLRRLYSLQRLDTYQFIELERTLARLTNSMGGCERIKKTPFPVSYSWMVDCSIYGFVVLLPFGLVEVPALGLVATSIALSFVFLTIECVAIHLQDPFSNRPSDTPMLTISRTIEINLKQMLRESDVPPEVEPEEGVFY